MKSIQKMGGPYKHLSIFLAMMVLGALFLGVAPVMASYGYGYGHGNVNGNGHTVICKDVCDSTLYSYEIGWSQDFKTQSVRVGRTTKKIVFTRDCTTYLTYKDCTQMGSCGNTGCAAVGTYEQPVRTTKRCGSWYVSYLNPIG